MYRERMGRYLTPPTQYATMSPEERSRRERWEAMGKAKVSHPAHGAVVVPHNSNLSALLCAAEVWGCNWLEIKDAEVWAAEPGTPAVKMPIHYK